MNAYTVLTMLAAALVIMRMVEHLNRMRADCVPCRVLWSVVGLAAGAAALLLSPVYGGVYDWRDALFAAAAAVYVWLDRRGPCNLGRIS